MPASFYYVNHLCASLYASGASSPMVDRLSARTRMPCSFQFVSDVSPLVARIACPRLISLPAPWQVLPKVSRYAFPCLPARMNSAPYHRNQTGWPTALYASGVPGCPGGNARVAPCGVHSWLFCPSTICSQTWQRCGIHRKPGKCVIPSDSRATPAQTTLSPSALSFAGW